MLLLFSVSFLILAYKTTFLQQLIERWLQVVFPAHVFDLSEILLFRRRRHDRSSDCADENILRSVLKIYKFKQLGVVAAAL